MVPNEPGERARRSKDVWPTAAAA